MRSKSYWQKIGHFVNFHFSLSLSLTLFPIFLINGRCLSLSDACKREQRRNHNNSFFLFAFRVKISFFRDFFWMKVGMTEMKKYEVKTTKLLILFPSRSRINIFLKEDNFVYDGWIKAHFLCSHHKLFIN